MSGLIVHEWLEPHGGSEKVVDAMLAAFPDSELVALWNDAPEKYTGVHQSWLAHTPLRHHKAAALPLLSPTWRHIVPRRDDIDFALVSSHLFAHHVDVRRCNGERVPKFVYAHTPARYIWEPSLDRRGSSRVARIAAAALKPVDKRFAQEPVKIAANSEFIRSRIQRTWERESKVIYPPVDVETILRWRDGESLLNQRESEIVEGLPSFFLLGASRFVPYKRLDWVIAVADSLDIPVVIAGTGADASRLHDLGESSRVPVEILEDPSTELLYELYRRAAVYVFPAIEDFGIMPVEAQAMGTAVVTTSIGGSRETFVEGVSGVSAEEDDVTHLAGAVRSALDLSPFDPVKAVGRFSRSRFTEELRAWVDEDGLRTQGSATRDPLLRSRGA